MAKRVYVDTSAYLCVLLREEGHGALESETDGAELLSSVLLPLEATRNLVRLSRDGRLPPETLQQCLTRLEEDVGSFELRDLTLELCMSRVLPLVSTPRSLDLAHLRTALWFHERTPISRFLTLDEGQRQAALELELPA
jgi:hypothetical protein